MIVDDTLYRHGVDTILIRCLTHEEVEKVFNYYHAGAYGGTCLDMLPRRIYSVPVNFDLPYFTIASSQSKIFVCARYLIVKSTNCQRQCILLSLWDHFQNEALNS